MRAMKKEKISQGKKIDINDDTIKYENKEENTHLWIERTFHEKNTGAEKLLLRVVFTQLGKKLRGEVAAIPVNGDIR